MKQSIERKIESGLRVTILKDSDADSCTILAITTELIVLVHRGDDYYSVKFIVSSVEASYSLDLLCFYGPSFIDACSALKVRQLI